MKLNLAELKYKDQWQGYTLPAFDIGKMTALTKQRPLWLHMGAGNIFRAFPAVLQQDLLEQGLADRGITVCECFDEEIIPAGFTPYDNLSLAVTLHADGGMTKCVIASIAEAFNDSLPQNGASTELQPNAEPRRLFEIIASPSLQIISFTITEKGYAVTDASGAVLPLVDRDRQRPPAAAETVIGRVTAGLMERYRAGAAPVALLSLDNCAGNGDRLAEAVRGFAAAWAEQGLAEQGFVAYVNSSRVSFPCSMIDKITPRPSETVAGILQKDGYEDARIVETAKHTFVSSFVNAEACQYLVVEDVFPNGRPALEKTGVYFTDRDTVQKAERMKVSACLNPLHTILAVTGMLLGYGSIAECTQDKRLALFIHRAAYDESLPTAANPGVISPEHFLRDVLTERLPNPFIPDTPARIACDTSQKIPVRFGETLKARRDAGMSVASLAMAPLFFALWLRYLLAVDDRGHPMLLSPDPRLPELTARLSGIKLGDTGPFREVLKPILSDTSIFGVDLYDDAIGLGGKTEALFERLVAETGAVSRELDGLLR